MNQALPDPPLPSAMDEYRSLRDETLKRVDLRSQILSFTLAFAASMLTLGLGANAYRSALLIYPIIAFFFAVGFAYNTLMLIEIGSYIRTIESRIPGLGWAGYLKTRYGGIEPFEVFSYAGLFLGTQFIAIALYDSFGLPLTRVDAIVRNLSLAALVGTLLTIVYAMVYHQLVLRQKPKT